MKRVWLVNINKNCKGQAGPSSRSRPPGNGDGFWSSLSFKGCGFLSSQLPVLDPRVFEQTENSYAQMWLWWALLVGTPSGQPNEGPQTLVPVGHPPPPKFLRFSVAVLTAEARPPGAPSTFLLSLVGLEFPGQNLPAIITAPRSTCFLSCSLWMSDLALRNKNPIGTAASFFLLSAMRCQKWTYY